MFASQQGHMFYQKLYKYTWLNHWTKSLDNIFVFVSSSSNLTQRKNLTLSQLLLKSVLFLVKFPEPYQRFCVE